MATFPTNISWYVGTQHEDDLGVNAERMDAGVYQTQTYVLGADTPIVISLVHRLQTLAEKDQIVSFLRANAKNIQLQDPKQGMTYDGKMISEGVRWANDGDGTRFQVRWQFGGRSL